MSMSDDRLLMFNFGIIDVELGRVEDILFSTITFKDETHLDLISESNNIWEHFTNGFYNKKDDEKFWKNWSERITGKTEDGTPVANAYKWIKLSDISDRDMARIMYKQTPEQIDKAIKVRKNMREIYGIKVR